MFYFDKYEGLANDFLIVSSDQLSLQDAKQFAPRVCGRRIGVGADGILIVNPQLPSMRVVNSDGSEALMCGNGIRCVARYLTQHHADLYADLETIEIDTEAGPHLCKVHEPNVSVRMKTPSFSGKMHELPFNQQIEIEGVRFYFVDVGNPHLVTFDEIDDRTIDKIGPRVGKRHDCNIEFASDREDGIAVRVFERGAGWTFACGTGACAAFAAYQKYRKPKTDRLRVYLPGGALEIRKVENELWMQGPARFVFRGEFDKPLPTSK